VCNPLGSGERPIRHFLLETLPIRARSPISIKFPARAPRQMQFAVKFMF
jgi:hypothetical protein